MPYPGELSVIRKIPQVCHAKGRVFFSIYYKTTDDAFKRAAVNWANEVKAAESFIPSQDAFLAKEVVTETDFKQAWNEVALYANMKNMSVWMGQIFSHASKQENGEDGLEFVRSGSQNEYHTLTRDEIIQLRKLPWAVNDGCLILAGCNTGRTDKRGWCPAQTFALHHRVITLGQNGYSYFSKQWQSYEETNPVNTGIFLWAYKRGKNGMVGDGTRILATVYRP